MGSELSNLHGFIFLLFSWNIFAKNAFFQQFFRPKPLFFRIFWKYAGKTTAKHFSSSIFLQGMLCGKLDHHKLEIYELAHQFVLHIYQACSSFPQDESNNLTSQIKRAAVSLPLNIAEATGCMSFRTCLNFLSFSYRSCMEIEAALRLCLGLGYLTPEQYRQTCEHLDKFTRKLYKYMEYISAQADKRSGYRQQQMMNTEFIKKHAGMDGPASPISAPTPLPATLRETRR
jgi:four helix bundle protein